MSKDQNTKTKDGAAAPARKVALLIDGEHGAAGAVVELPGAEADSLVSAGQADDNPAAVAYRESVAAGPSAEAVLS